MRKKIQQVVNPSAEEDTDMEDNEDQDEPTTSGQVADMLEQCLKWYERQDEATASSLLLLKRIRDLRSSKQELQKFKAADTIIFC